MVSDKEMLLKTDYIDNPMAIKVLGRPVQPKADYPYVLQLAKSCIEECSTNHTECQHPESLSCDQFPILPSRVIDIGEHEEQLPRLLLT